MAVGSAGGMNNASDFSIGAELPAGAGVRLPVGTSSIARGPAGGANGANADTWGSSGIWNSGISTNAAIRLP